MGVKKNIAVDTTGAETTAQSMCGGSRLFLMENKVAIKALCDKKYLPPIQI